jgi:hypothetical protein
MRASAALCISSVCTAVVVDDDDGKDDGDGGIDDEDVVVSIGGSASARVRASFLSRLNESYRGIYQKMAKQLLLGK